VCAGLLAGLLLLAALALAPSPAAAADEEEAKIHFDKAQTAYKLGRFKEAIREYEAAYRAMSDPAFLFNIAQAHRQQYRLDKGAPHLQKALSLYKNYLREMPSAQNRETVQKLIDELKSLLTAVEDNQGSARGKLARLVLRGDQAGGAQVVLDGKLVGTIPHSQEMEPGVHLVKVTKQGFKEWSTSVNIEAGAKLDLPVMLQSEAPAGGEVSSTPIYKKWWFWTIVGAVVVGGTGTGIYFATRGDDIPAMPTVDLR